MPAALSAGVPLVVAGDTQEKPDVAAHVAHAAVGLDLRAGAPSSRALGRAIERA